MGKRCRKKPEIKPVPVIWRIASCCCNFRTLIILILIILQFSRCREGHGDGDGIVSNKILFIITLYFLVCCDHSRSRTGFGGYGAYY